MNNQERIHAQKNDFDKEGNPIKALTQEAINEMTSRGSNTFSSGREKQVGDWLLFGFLHNINEGNDHTNNTIQLITLHEEEYGTIYTDAPLMNEMRSTIMLELVKI
jgi:hypothetical protein